MNQNRPSLENDFNLELPIAVIFHIYILHVKKLLKRKYVKMIVVVLRWLAYDFTLFLLNMFVSCMKNGNEETH